MKNIQLFILLGIIANFAFADNVYHSNPEHFLNEVDFKGSVVQGPNAISTNKSAFVFNGDETINYVSHGEGTFNVNPAGGIDGLYIGDKPFTTYLSDGSIKIYGATNAEDDYITYTNVQTLKFDQDSGFRVIPDEETNSLKVSLGSSWTELIPNISDPTILPRYKGNWSATTYDEGDIVSQILIGDENFVTTNFWVAIEQTEDTDIPGESNKWIIQTMPDNLRPSGEEKLAIKIVETNQTGTFWDYSNTEKNQKTFYIGINKQALSGDVQLENIYIPEDITVENLQYPIGRYTNGSVIAKNTTLDVVFENMFRRVVPPTYKELELSVSFTPKKYSDTKTYEIGENFSTVKFNSSCKTNDAGKITKYEYYLRGIPQHTNETANIEDSWTISPGNILILTNDTKFTSVVYYEQGPIKKDTDGHDYEEGRIEAGSKTNSITISPARYMFYGTSTAIEPIEISTNTLFNINRQFTSTKLTINNIPLGTRQIIFAVPNTLYASSFLLEDTQDPTMHDNLLENQSMEKITLSPVYCINGYRENTLNNTYKVYYYNSPNPTISSTIYITIQIAKDN